MKTWKDTFVEDREWRKSFLFFSPCLAPKQTLGLQTIAVVAATPTQVPDTQKSLPSWPEELDKGASVVQGVRGESLLLFPLSLFSHLFAPEEDLVVESARQSRGAKTPAC